MAQAILPDVLTLEEASAYLRLPVAVVFRQASQGNIPGRKIEDNWRFLKTAFGSSVVQTNQDVANKQNHPKPKKCIQDADSVREKADKNYW